MAFDFHENRKVYFEHQRENAAQFVIPFIANKLAITPGMQIMEIGCGEGGVLKAFLDKGAKGLGIELDAGKSALARTFLQKEISDGNVVLLNRNIYDIDVSTEFSHQFDLIILKDVIEHIFDQQRLINSLHAYLKPGGYIYFGFPPWYMPFGGHQQVCKSKLLSLLPWFHLLPVFLYTAILKIFGEEQGTIKELLEIKETGISIERFERTVKASGFSVVHQQHYLINPIYEWKFGIKPRLQFSWINHIPYFRDFLTTCSYYLIRK